MIFDLSCFLFFSLNVWWVKVNGWIENKWERWRFSNVSSLYELREFFLSESSVVLLGYNILRYVLFMSRLVVILVGMFVELLSFMVSVEMFVCFFFVLWFFNIMYCFVVILIILCFIVVVKSLLDKILILCKRIEWL